ncbi:hypothetical protein OfM1_18300 [Lactovum odontotermitis]
MSANKILALIGSIFATIFAIFYFFIGFVGGLGALAGNSYRYNYSDYSDYTYNTIYAVVGVLFVVMAIIAVVAAIINWVAFAHLDTAKEKPWKVYFLVMGILSCLTVFGLVTAFELIPGVLFILAFALKSSKTETQQPLTAVSAAPAEEVIAPSPHINETSPELTSLSDADTAETSVAAAAAVSEAETSLVPEISEPIEDKEKELPSAPEELEIAEVPEAAEAEIESEAVPLILSSVSESEVASLEPKTDIASESAEKEASFEWTEAVSDSEKGE